LLERIQQSIATLGFIGYLPYAPGTFGSAFGLLLIILLKPDDLVLLIILLPLFLIGIASSHNTEKLLGRDSRHIVIDEFCGYLVAVLFIPKNIPYLFSAFILFRVFDILKPPPIRRLEGLISGGKGIMLDDILAAIYTNICIQLWRYLF